MEYIEQTDLTVMIGNVVAVIEQVPGVASCLVFDGEDIQDLEFLNSYLNGIEGAVVYVDLTSLDTFKSRVNEGLDANVFFNLYVAARKDYTDDARFENNSMVCLATCQRICGEIYENNFDCPILDFPDISGMTKFLSGELGNGSVTAYAVSFSVPISLFKKNKY